MIIPDKVTSDYRKSSISDNIRQVALLASGKSQKEPLQQKRNPKQNHIISSCGDLFCHHEDHDSILYITRPGFTKPFKKVK